MQGVRLPPDVCVHFANANLIGDGLLDAERPEFLMYEERNGRMAGGRRVPRARRRVARKQRRTTRAEGQHFHYVGSPNRYGLPPFYELHVWAWLDNPSGTFTDWNPRVACDQYTTGGHE